MTKTAKRNRWAGQKRKHKIASLIGHAFKRGRRTGPKDPGRYLAAAGVSKSQLRKYVAGRKTSRKVLRGKRKGSKKRRSYKAYGVAVNRGRRRTGSYAKFVKAYARKTGKSGPALFRAAGRAWRGGARRNPGVAPGSVYFNQQLPAVRAMLNRKGKGRKKARRNVHRTYGNNYRTYGNMKRKRKKSKRNPVLPYFAFENRRKKSRRNPVLPIAAFNNARAVTADPISAVVAAGETILSIDYWKTTVLPMGAGFIGSQFVGGMFYSWGQKLVGAQTGVLGSLQRVFSRTAAAAALSGLSLWGLKDRKAASNVLAGGLISVVVQLIQEIFGKDTYEKITGMAGTMGAIAQDLTHELKERIAQSVRSQIESAEGGVSGAPGVGAVNAFVSTQNLQTAPRLGPGPRIGEFVNTQDLQTAPVLEHQGGAPMVSDLSAYSDSMADMMLV